jgi:hypothetical protein
MANELIVRPRIHEVTDDVVVLADRIERLLKRRMTAFWSSAVIRRRLLLLAFANEAACSAPPDPGAPARRL